MSAALALVEHYIESHPHDLARRVDVLSTADGVALFEALPAQSAAALLPLLAQERAARLVEAMSPELGGALLGHLEIDDAVAVVRRLDASAATAALAHVGTAQAYAIDALRTYPPETAGGVMDPDVLTVPLASTVADVRALLESSPGHLYYYLYVVDDAQRLAGVFDLAELLQADPAAPVSSIVTAHVLWLSADAPLVSVFAHPGWRTLDALPVVGPDRRLVGVLRHRRMRMLRERAAPASGEDRTVRTMMALGEIYWLGLSGLLQGIAAAASDAPERERAR